MQCVKNLFSQSDNFFWIIHLSRLYTNRWFLPRNKKNVFFFYRTRSIRFFKVSYMTRINLDITRHAFKLKPSTSVIARNLQSFPFIHFRFYSRILLTAFSSNYRQIKMQSDLFEERLEKNLPHKINISSILYRTWMPTCTEDEEDTSNYLEI